MEEIFPRLDQKYSMCYNTCSMKHGKSTIRKQNHHGAKWASQYLRPALILQSVITNTNGNIPHHVHFHVWFYLKSFNVPVRGMKSQEYYSTGSSLQPSQQFVILGPVLGFDTKAGCIYHNLNKHTEALTASILNQPVNRQAESNPLDLNIILHLIYNSPRIEYESIGNRTCLLREISMSPATIGIF